MSKSVFRPRGVWFRHWCTVVCVMVSGCFLCNEGIAVTNKAQPMLVRSAICDTSYGMAMEKAILTGNIRQVDELLKQNQKDINDVIVVNWQHSIPYQVRFSDSEATYWTRRAYDLHLGASKEYNQDAINYFLSYQPGQDYQFEYSLAETYQQNSVAGRTGDFYSISNSKLDGPKLLGAPLMIAARAHNTFMMQELLKRGANPNVFIEVKNFYPGESLFRGGIWRNCPRRYICALFDLYMRLEDTSLDTANACAKLLFENGAGFIRIEDDYGRTAIWDAARLRSVLLLETMVNCGFDVKHKDNIGNHILDYLKFEPNGASERMLVQCLERLAKYGLQYDGQMRQPEHKAPAAQPLPRGDLFIPQGGGLTPGFNSIRPERAPDIKDVTHEITCTTCKGRGWVAGFKTTTYGNMKSRICPDCGEVSASHSHDICPSCGGKGKERRLN
ncbi:MAG: hypothetical protein IJJ33_06450 [Victivallales bacterium]|nr:hypothetical protein [Victivallales bacterium]